MSGLWVVALIGGALVSGAARAVDVEVTYTLSANPQHEISPIASGAPITSLTAKMIASFTTVSASTWSGTPLLQSLVLYAAPVGTPNQSGSGYNPGGTFSFPGIPAAADSCNGTSCLWLRTGTVPLGFAGISGSLMATSHLNTFVKIVPGAGGLSFSARQAGPTAGTGTYSFQITTRVVGMEVSRTLVPEPDGTGLVLVGGTAVFAAAGIRRWRRAR